MIDDYIHNQLKTIWRDLLGIEPRSTLDNFFSMGGDDILFKILIIQLMKEFGISKAVLNKNKISNFGEQVNLIYNTSFAHLNENKMIVSLKNYVPCSTITCPIIIFIHPIGGTLFTYSNLIHQINTNSAIFGIQDGCLAGEFRSFNSIEEQAEFYISILIKKFSLNYIILVGHSYGGSLAFEMARQILVNYKIEIDHLIMIDSWASMPFDITFQNSFKKIISRQITKMNMQHFMLNNKLKNTWENLLWERMGLLLKYVPQKCHIKTTLFLASESVEEYTVPANAIDDWKNYIKNLKIITVAGNHENMMDSQNADYLCNQLTLLCTKNPI